MQLRAILLAFVFLAITTAKYGVTQETIPADRFPETPLVVSFSSLETIHCRQSPLLFVR